MRAVVEFALRPRNPQRVHAVRYVKEPACYLLP